MLRLLRSLWIWLACSALIVLWVAVVSAVRLSDRDPLRRRTARAFRLLGRIVARMNPWRIHLSGTANLDRFRTFVIVGNHQSLADIPLVAHLRVDAKWLGKAELFRVPALGWMMRMAGDIPVARGDRRKAAQALLHCARCLRQGCSVVFFPEGTRSPGGEVLPFNDGPFQLAIREKVPVLPLVIEGTGGALPKHSLLFRGTHDLHLRVLEPVPVEGWNVKQSPELRDLVRGLIVTELERIRGRAAEGA